MQPVSPSRAAKFWVITSTPVSCTSHPKRSLRCRSKGGPSHGLYGITPVTLSAQGHQPPQVPGPNLSDSTRLPVLNLFSSLSSLPHPDSTKIPRQVWRSHTGLWGGGIPWIQSGPSLTGIWAMWRIFGQAQGRDIMLPQDSGHTSGFAHQDIPVATPPRHTGTRPQDGPGTPLGTHPPGHTLLVQPPGAKSHSTRKVSL